METGGMEFWCWRIGFFPITPLLHDSKTGCPESGTAHFKMVHVKTETPPLTEKWGLESQNMIPSLRVICWFSDRNIWQMCFFNMLLNLNNKKGEQGQIKSRGTNSMDPHETIKQKRPVTYSK